MLKLLYATFGSEEEAITIAKILLAEKLIACANVFGDSTSIYSWEGDVKQQQEVILFAKTTNEKYLHAIEKIKELHSYELPCIIILPIEAGFAPFIEWVKNETVKQ